VYIHNYLNLCQFFTTSFQANTFGFVIIGALGIILATFFAVVTFYPFSGKFSSKKQIGQLNDKLDASATNSQRSNSSPQSAVALLGAPEKTEKAFHNIKKTSTNSRLDVMSVKTREGIPIMKENPVITISSSSVVNFLEPPKPLGENVQSKSNSNNKKEANEGPKTEFGSLSQYPQYSNMSGNQILDDLLREEGDETPPLARNSSKKDLKAKKPPLGQSQQNLTSTRIEEEIERNNYNSESIVASSALPEFAPIKEDSKNKRLTLLYDATEQNIENNENNENNELQKEDSVVIPKPVTRELSEMSAFSADSLKSTDIDDAVRQLENLHAETND